MFCISYVCQKVKQEFKNVWSMEICAAFIANAQVPIAQVPIDSYFLWALDWKYLVWSYERISMYAWYQSAHMYCADHCLDKSKYVSPHTIIVLMHPNMSLNRWSLPVNILTCLSTDNHCLDTSEYVSPQMIIGWIHSNKIFYKCEVLEHSC